MLNRYVQIFVVFYEIDPVPSQGSAGLIFARVVADLIHGCLIPLVVSVTAPFSQSNIQDTAFEY